MNEVQNFLRSVGGPSYNLGLLNSSPNVSPVVGLNGYEKTPTQAAQSAQENASSQTASGALYPGSSVGNPDDVNSSVSQAINSFGGSGGRSSTWDGTSGTTGIGQGATTDANQSYYTNKALGDFATGMNYTPMGAFKSAFKNGIAYNMNNRDLLGQINDPNNGYSDPISALDAIQGWSGSGVALASPSMAANPMSTDPATAQQRALAAALSRGGGGGGGQASGNGMTGTSGNPGKAKDDRGE